jgi:hypothetical protein
MKINNNNNKRSGGFDRIHYEKLHPLKPHYSIIKTQKTTHI